MRILHLGGYKAPTITLAKYQRALGHDVHLYGQGADYTWKLPGVAPVEGKAQLDDLLLAKFEIVHLHISLGMPLTSRNWAEDARADLERIKASGAKLVYSSYDCDLTDRSAQSSDPNSVCGRCIAGGDEVSIHPVCAADSDRAKRLALLNQYVEHIFLGAPENLSLAQKHRSWSWLAQPFDLEEIPTPAPREPKKGQFNILHIPHRPAQMGTKVILEAIEQLKSKKLPVVFNLIVPELFFDFATILSRLKECDLLIEQIGRESTGALGLLAMAYGKTVISGNSARAKSAWEQLKVNPVLDSNPENLVARLESIVREPKCTRDFGKRSRKYIETYHNAEVIAQLSLDRYKQILK